MTQSKLAVAILNVVVVTMGCGDQDRAPGIADCDGILCGNPGGGTSTPGDAGQLEGGLEAGDAEAGIDASIVDLSGNIVRLVDETFTQTVPFEAWGYLRVPTLSGDEEVGFGGDAGPGYTASGVITGGNWFTVVPNAVFLDGVMPTYAYLQVPEEGSMDFPIPLVDRDILTVLYASLAPPTVVRADASHVVIVFERGGERVSGVTVSGHPTAEAIAYDQGVGFASDAMETGLNGAVLLVNVVGTAPLRWRDKDGTETSLSLVHVPGQASFVRIALP